MDDLISREQALDAIHDWKPSDVFDEFNPTTAFTIIYALPSANPDLSGYSDRLWKSAYDRGYERCRQDAIDLVQEKLNRYLKYIGSIEDTEYWAYARGLLQDIVNNIRDEHKTPSAQPERKKGKWINRFDGDEWFWFCSACKEQWYEEDLWMGGNEFPNFCPNCGADMRGEEDGTP